MPRPETCFDRHGRLVTMAIAKNWRMVRRPGCNPSVLAEKAWQKLSEVEWTAEQIAAYDAELARRDAGMRAVMRFLTTGEMPADAKVTVHGPRRPA